MKKLIVISLIATLSFPLIVKSDEIALPVITKPAILNEGTQRVLTPAQIAELLPWAKDSKLFLNDLLDNIQSLSTVDKIDKLQGGIQQVVGESAPKNSELLMRYILNRSLVLCDIIAKEADMDNVGTNDSILRVLQSSIKMAIRYYEIDMSRLNQKADESTFALFGMDYFSFLTELNKSIFDASAQYAIERTALEWFQWDLYRDSNNTLYAPQIVKINNGLKTFTTKKISDSQAIASVRQMKKIAQQLDVQGTLGKMQKEKQLAQAKTDAEKKAILEKAEREKKRLVKSDILIEKSKASMGLLLSGSWEVRRNAAKELSEMIGQDVSLGILLAFFEESDSDVYAAMYLSLVIRLGNENYLFKDESLDKFNENTLKVIRLKYSNLSGNWGKRRNIATFLGQVTTIESYRLLAEMGRTESDSDVQTEIRNSMTRLNAILK